MKCLVCKHFDIVAGEATVVLERGDVMLVVKHVAARDCPDCGEEYVDQAVAAHLLKVADQRAGAPYSLPILSTVPLG